MPFSFLRSRGIIKKKHTAWKEVTMLGNLLEVVTVYDILFAAAAAYLLTSLILRVSKVVRIFKRKENIVMDYKLLDLVAVTARCKELFPIDTVYFHGKVFRRGMRVQIITLQKKIIEGELIGKNRVDLVCVRTPNHIIAHEIEKIEDIKILEDTSGTLV